MKLRFTHQAKRDLDNIADYIREQILTGHFVCVPPSCDRCRHLSSFPASGDSKG